jgi:predicted ArsR family transcriptional regulator
MQSTRQQIIEYLKEKGPATVDDLATVVELTPMAIRHHLNVLQADDLITSYAVRRQDGPGRPSQVYRLTEAADKFFPVDYYRLTDYLLDELKLQLGHERVAEIFNNIATRLASEVPTLKNGETIEERLTELIAFLTDKGFVADWEAQHEGYLIHAYSCPYRQVARTHAEVCLIDQQIISAMLNTTPVCIACLPSADDHCTYHVSRPIELFTD